MSDQSEYPSESIGSDNGLRPLSNVDDLSLGNPSNNDLSRIMNRAGIALANGFPLMMTRTKRMWMRITFRSTRTTQMISHTGSVARPLTIAPSWMSCTHLFSCCLSQMSKTVSRSKMLSRSRSVARVTRCPELSLGLFTLPLLGEGEPKPRPTLVGHIIATRTSEPLVTDRSMRLPDNWQNERWSFEDSQAVGHEEGGSTIAIHSLAVEPEHQGKQVGSTLMKSYIHRIREAQIADRIAIIAHDHLIPFYESFGFESRGPSKCQFGGGGWVDLVLEFGPEPQE
ncbi:hypothetical protein N7444_003245 [Penicillium canescens]|nr:hypothetical protein N7444_003245 [Penicillium canescens]